MFSILQIYNSVFDKQSYCTLNLRLQIGNFNPAWAERLRVLNNDNINDVNDFVKFIEAGMEKFTVEGCPATVQASYFQTLNTLRKTSIDGDRYLSSGFFSGMSSQDMASEAHNSLVMFDDFGELAQSKYDEYFESAHKKIEKFRQEK